MKKSIGIGSIIIFQCDDPDYLPTIALVLDVDGDNYTVSIDGSLGKARKDQVITIFEENQCAVNLAWNIINNYQKRRC